MAQQQLDEPGVALRVVLAARAAQLAANDAGQRGVELGVRVDIGSVGNQLRDQGFVMRHTGQVEHAAPPDGEIGLLCVGVVADELGGLVAETLGGGVNAFKVLPLFGRHGRSGGLAAGEGGGGQCGEEEVAVHGVQQVTVVLRWAMCTSPSCRGASAAFMAAAHSFSPWTR